MLGKGGEQALQSYRAEPLSWDEIQSIAGGGLVGLPAGYDADKHAPRCLNIAVPEAVTRCVEGHPQAYADALAGIANEAEAEDNEGDPAQSQVVCRNPLMGSGAAAVARHCLSLALESVSSEAHMRELCSAEFVQSDGASCSKLQLGMFGKRSGVSTCGSGCRRELVLRAAKFATALARSDMGRRPGE